MNKNTFPTHPNPKSSSEDTPSSQKWKYCCPCLCILCIPCCLCCTSVFCLSKLNSCLIGPLERAFYKYGKTIARSPILFILFCLIITAFCCIGITSYREETNRYKLWTPVDSEFLKVMEWKEDKFPSDHRTNMVIFEAENVLDRSVLLEILRVHDVVVETKTDLLTWEAVCAKVPTISVALFGRRKRDIEVRDSPESDITKESDIPLQTQTRTVRQASDDDDDDGFDWSLILPRDRYCEFLNSMKEVCFESSILEVFGYDRDFISSLTQEQIIRDVNTVDTSAITGFPINVSKILGKIERDADGQIIKARAAMNIWMTKINRTAIRRGNHQYDDGAASLIDTATYEWEQNFIENVLNDTERPKNVSAYLMGSTSFGTISKGNIQTDLEYLGLGFIAVFLYIVIMLGKFNMVEQRPVLSLLGLSCVGLAVGVSYGICSAFNVPYGPVNSILPFLLLGLGVDDMFVIMQAWNNLTPLEQQQDLPERIGCALRHAGVSITVTSVTDFAAFAIGSTSLLPGLRSFCIYAAVGIASIFFFQATFFVACLSIDQRRLEDNRQGLIWCWKLKNWTPNQCSQRDLCQTFFSEVYAKILLHVPVKILVLLLTVALTAVCGWGVSHMRQQFNFMWFLPQDSYLYIFFTKLYHYYPSSGAKGVVYFGDINLWSELPKIEELSVRLKKHEYIAEVDSWYDKYKRYWEKQGFEVPGPNQTEDEFLDQLSKFLHSPSGSPYRNRDFHFSSDLNCTDKSPSVTASAINYKHMQMSTSAKEVQAMDSVRELVRNMNFNGFVKAWSKRYGEWETNKVIEEELYRNMGIAIAVVTVVTSVLIANFVASFMVVLCVVLTLVDVGALMHWWGLTIDTVSCVDLVLAIGLCVDYSAHIGHTFMTKVGTRDERTRSTLATMGPAVLNGGFTTFLSFVFLANSSSHVFSTFFKVFFAVFLFGLYHGLVFLPVLLSIMGPSSYANVTPVPPTPTSTRSTTPTISSTLESGEREQFPPGEKVKDNGNGAQVKGMQEVNQWMEQNGIFNIRLQQGLQQLPEYIAQMRSKYA